MAGPQFQFNEAISFQVPVETQAEADSVANALSAVPEAEQCGWVKDRIGVSWQIAPKVLMDMLRDPDREKASRVMAQMMKMVKLDIAPLEQAYRCE